MSFTFVYEHEECIAYSIWHIAYSIQHHSSSPLTGTSPGIGSWCLFCCPVSWLSLSCPVLSNLEASSSRSRSSCSSNSSWCWGFSRSRSRCLAISSPVSHSSISSPFLLVRSNKVSSLNNCRGFGSSFSSLPLFLLNLLRVSVEEEVRHDLPGHVSGDGPPQPQHLPGKEPPHQTNGLGGLVVARDRDINELGWRVNIGKSNDGDICIAALSDRLMV